RRGRRSGERIVDGVEATRRLGVLRTAGERRLARRLGVRETAAPGPRAVVRQRERAREALGEERLVGRDAARLQHGQPADVEDLLRRRRRRREAGHKPAEHRVPPHFPPPQARAGSIIAGSATVRPGPYRYLTVP